jgi:hypothetical protein
MLSFCTKWLFKSLKTLGLLALTLNIMIASIPRCAWLSDLFVTAASAPTLMMSCHDSSKSEPVAGGAKIQNLSFCACSLLSFTTLALPTFEFESFIRFKVHSTRELLFGLVLHQAGFIPLPEPPYPKS